MGNLFGIENISQNKINNLNNKQISKNKNDKENNNSTKPYFRPK